MAGVLGVLLVLFGLLLPARLPRIVAVLLMVLGLGWFSDFEMFREFIRKPHVITGYIYGNGVEVATTEQYKKDGYLKRVAFRTGDDGADLFRHACRSCHTISGYTPPKSAFDGADREFIASIIKAAHLLRGNMPPFLGTAVEAAKIAEHLHKQMDHRPLAEIYGLQGAGLGRKSYEVRCGKCHVPGKESDKSKAFADQSASDLIGMVLAMLAGIACLLSLLDYLKAFMRTPAIWALTVGVVLSLGALHFFFKKKFWPSGLMLFVSMLTMVYARRTVRLLKLEGACDPSSLPIVPQWSPFILFLICFVVMLAMLVYMFRLFFRSPKPQP